MVAKRQGNYFRSNIFASLTAVLTALTAFIILEIIASVAIGFSCFKSPEPREIRYHAVGGAIDHTWHTNTW